jgi:hypothetical protein
VPSPQITNDRHAGSKGGIAGKYPSSILLTVITLSLSLKDLKAPVQALIDSLPNSVPEKGNYHYIPQTVYMGVKWMAEVE